MCLEPAGRNIKLHSDRMQTPEHKQCSRAVQSVKLNRRKLASNLRTHAPNFPSPLTGSFTASNGEKKEERISLDFFLSRKKTASPKSHFLPHFFLLAQDLRLLYKHYYEIDKYYKYMLLYLFRCNIYIHFATFFTIVQKNYYSRNNIFFFIRTIIGSRFYSIEYNNYHRESNSDFQGDAIYEPRAVYNLYGVQLSVARERKRSSLLYRQNIYSSVYHTCSGEISAWQTRIKKQRTKVNWTTFSKILSLDFRVWNWVPF